MLAPIIETRLPVPAVFSLYARSLWLEAALYGVLTAFLFTLWPLARTEDVRAATLFRDALSTAQAACPDRVYIAATGLAGLNPVDRLGRLVQRLDMADALDQRRFGRRAGPCWRCRPSLIRRLARVGTPWARGRPALRWALSAISDPREGASSVVLSLGLGLSVLAAVGQIDGTLRNAISGNLPDVAPSYFFVDIQKDQMPGFHRTIWKLTPQSAGSKARRCCAGIITRINGKPAREVAGRSLGSGW